MREVLKAAGVANARTWRPRGRGLRRTPDEGRRAGNVVERAVDLEDFDIVKPTKGGSGDEDECGRHARGDETPRWNEAPKRPSPATRIHFTKVPNW